jgi:carboxyl-terminal processing protease
MNAFASEAQARMRDVDDGSLCGWIVDLRDNAGGNVWPMLGALGPLMGDGELGGGWVDAEGTRLDAVQWYRDGVVGIDSEDGRVERIVIDGVPFVPSRPAMPVAVLLSGRTASSGEGVAVAFAGLDHARSFGEHTVGLTSANVPHVLPDGALLVFPVGYSVDRKGRVYPSGVTPDKVTGAEAALEEAKRWLLAQPACSGD